MQLTAIALVVLACAFIADAKKERTASKVNVNADSTENLQNTEEAQPKKDPIAPEDDKLIIETTFKPDVCVVSSKDGDKLSMHYTGSLYETGVVFDSSSGRPPLEFTVGAGQVISGWDQGLLDMCIYEKRKLTIPAELAYGKRATKRIPADSRLVFEVELLKINGKSNDDYMDDL